MRHVISAIALFLFSALLLTSCGGQQQTPRDLMQAFSQAYDNMPAGQIYQNGVAEWEEEYLSHSLQAALFSEDNGENAFSLCNEYAIFLSSSMEGGEIAFLSCISRTDAARVADMCAARITRVRQTKPDAAILRDACVLRHGKTVVLLLMPENDRAREICERLF